MDMHAVQVSHTLLYRVIQREQTEATQLRGRSAADRVQRLTHCATTG